MALSKPYYRCYRPNIKNSDLKYLRDERNVKNPYDYVRKLEILYSRLEKIFEYIEPDNKNRDTYSIQNSSLLFDICTTLEANFKDILKINEYIKPMKNCNINDYFLIEKSHHLSSYEIKIPFWKNEGQIRKPFEKWGNEMYDTLNWYQAYNHVKHNMIEKFNEATLDSLVDAFCGLVVIISAQFYNEEILQDPQTNKAEFFGYMSNEGKYNETIKTPFIIKYPTDWKQNEKYAFDWEAINNEKESFFKFDYSKFKINQIKKTEGNMNYFDEKSIQIKPIQMNAFGIEIESRYGKADEIIEMINFCELLCKDNITCVKKIFFDSKACICNFISEDQIYSNYEKIKIIDAAHKSISQFTDFDCCIDHGIYLNEDPSIEKY